MGDKSKELYGKFVVQRTDGKDAPGEKHHDCRYFVLDVDHDPHAKAALEAYATSCEAEYPLLAADLRGMAFGRVRSQRRDMSMNTANDSLIDAEALDNASSINKTTIKGELRKLWPAINKKLTECGWTARDMVKWLDEHGVSMSVELFRVYLRDIDVERGYDRSKSEFKKQQMDSLKTPANEKALGILIGESLRNIALVPMSVKFVFVFTDEDDCHICDGNTEEEALRNLLIVASEQSWKVVQILN